EVYLSIWAEEYVGDKFHFEILDIYGTSFSQLNPETNGVSDTRKPYLALKESLPTTLYVKVGEQVYLPEVIAYDVYLKEVASSVFYLKDTTSESLVGVQNGMFTPTKTGIHTIVYTATDNFGNVQTLEIKINAVKKDVLTLNVEKITDMGAGQWVRLPEYEIFSANGKTDLSIYVQFGETRTEIDLNNPEIFLSNVGAYSVEYVYNDALTTKSYAYTFNSVASENITFDDFALPRYMIKNAKYTIDKVKAYEYKTLEPTSQLADIYVKEDDGEFKKLVGNYEVKANNKVQFKYVYSNAETTSAIIPVVDVGFGSSLTMDKYFSVKGDGTLTATKEGVVLSDSTGGTERIEFINAIPFSTFRFGFSLKTSGSIGSVTMKLTDYYDSSKMVEIKLTPRGEAITLSVNGVSTEMSKNLFGTELEFFYNAGIKSIAEKGGTVLGMENPFTTNLVFFEFSINDAVGNFEMNIAKVGNQSISSATRDRFPGTITYENLFGGVNTPGSTVTVCAAQGLDVLSPYYDGNMKISVRDMENNYVTSTD
ncbi:MAG: hypothetical protein J6A63_02130, partial [Clostridia bacterium]|nr:hypothetical protein [Clostridia bacterium]